MKPQRSVQALDFMEKRVELFTDQQQRNKTERNIVKAESYEQSPAAWEHNRRVRKDREREKSNVGESMVDQPIHLPPIQPVNALGYPPTDIKTKMAEREKERVAEARQEEIEKARAIKHMNPTPSEAELRILQQIRIRELLT